MGNFTPIPGLWKTNLKNYFKVFSSCHGQTKKQKIWVLREKSNLQLDSALWCSTTKPQTVCHGLGHQYFHIWHASCIKLRSPMNKSSCKKMAQETTVIRETEVDSNSLCQSGCVDEERCLPYNFRTIKVYPGKFKCQLSALIHLPDLTIWLRMRVKFTEIGSWYMQRQNIYGNPCYLSRFVFIVGELRDNEWKIPTILLWNHQEIISHPKQMIRFSHYLKLK